MKCTESVHRQMIERIRKGESLEHFCECVRGDLSKNIERARKQLDDASTEADYKQWCLIRAEKEKESLEIYQRFLAFEEKFCKKYGLTYQ